MIHELQIRNLNFKSGVTVTIDYKGLIINSKRRCDLLVEGSLVVEFKAVESVAPTPVPNC